MRNIHRALAGDTDGALVSQLKLMRQDSNDRLDALKKAQSEALQVLSQMGSRALVEALRDVIKDFNARINEQFGENFKHLNEGVAKLLVWQDQHRQHVEVMAARLEETLKVAQATAETHRQVVDQSSAFARTAADLSDLLSALETQKAQINAYAQSLAALLNSAKDAMPEIESRITGIAMQLAEASSQSQQIMSKAVEENAENIGRTLEEASKASATAVEEHNRQVAQLVVQSQEHVAAMATELARSASQNQQMMATAVEENAASIRRILEDSSKASTKAAEEQGRQITQLVEQSKEHITAMATELARSASQNQQTMVKAVEENTASISRTLEAASRTSVKAAEEQGKQITQLVAKSKDQIKLLDEALSEELTKSLETLGRQLAALSEKFVKDYTPLTDRLRDVVRIAERVR